MVNASHDPLIQMKFVLQSWISSVEDARWSQISVLDLIELPKRKGQGQLALPVFSLAKIWAKSPVEIATSLADNLKKMGMPKEVLQVEAIGGFVNFTFTPNYLQTLLEGLLSLEDRIGHSDAGHGKKVVIDFSSPNVAKPMHIGHLRATVIGQALANLAKTQGYEVIGLNHLGDWGVQFGNLAWAYQNWGSEYPFKTEPFESLYKLYVRFHAEAEVHPELAALGAETFKKLENGDPEIEKIWKMVIEISMKDYDRLWKMLGVQHELVRGESFYNDRMAPVEAELTAKGLLVESDGAMVVSLEDENMVPCLIRKSDGASLYATRDLASAFYRMKDLGADLNLYVVGAEQTLHFRQVFSVLKKMGYEWYKDCHHISFGMYRFKDIGKMSSRKGNVIFLEDVLARAIEMVRKVIESKNPNLEDKETVARQVGVGAIIFNDLMNDRVKNVEFDWDKVLDFEGDSGPYVQYSYVRCLSLERKMGASQNFKFETALTSHEEVELMKHLLLFPSVLAQSFEVFKPHLVASYLIDLCRSFGQFYNSHRIQGESPEIIASRMALVGAVKHVIHKGLSVLNMEAPKAM